MQVTALLLFKASWAVIDGFPLDDAWIHQVVARTFANTGTLGYAAGQHGAGATSYLWAALLAVNFKWLHVDPVVFALALNVALSIGTGQILLALLLRGPSETRPPWAHAMRGFFAAGLTSLGGNYVWLAYCGMEANLVLFLTVLVVFAYTYPGQRPGRSALCAGVFAGLLALTRPEVAAFAPLVAVTTRWVGRKWKDAFALLAPWGVGLSIYLGSNLYFTHALAPPTLQGRSWLWLEGSGLGRGEQILELLITWIDRLRNYSLGTSSNVAFWISIGLIVASIVRAIGVRDRGLLVLLLLTGAHCGMYALTLPTTGHGGRYQPFVPVLYLTLVALGSSSILERAATLVKAARWNTVLRALATPAACAAWVGLVLVGLLDWSRDHACAVVHIRATEMGAAKAINALPPGNVASFDIGATGFFSERPILDIGGLSDPKASALLREGRIWEYLRDHQIQYVVLPLGYPSVLPDPVDFAERLRLSHNPAVELMPVRILSSPFYIWLSGALATQHSAPRQGVFRITYTGASQHVGSELPPRAPLPLGASLNASLTPQSRAVVLRGLGLLARAGIPVSLVLTDKPEAVVDGPADAWLVRMGPWGAVVRPPAGHAEWEAPASALMSERLQVFTEARDFGASSMAAMKVIEDVLHRFTPSISLPLLPAVEPKDRTRNSTPVDTLAWGILLAGLAAAGDGWLITMMRRWGRFLMNLGRLAKADREDSTLLATKSVESEGQLL